MKSKLFWKEKLRTRYSMNKLIKILIIPFLGLFIQPLNAQTFGLKAGLNMSTMFEKDDQYTYSNNYTYNPGFHIGLTLDIPFNQVISFEPALMFTTKGTKYEISESGIVLNGKANLYYIDVPLNFKLGFKLDRRGSNKVFFTAGPYIGYGITGKLEASVDFNGQSESDSEDVKWGDNAEEDNFKNLDYGMTAGAGIELSALTFGVFYDYGFANISAYQENGLNAQNRVLKISIGYRFNANSKGGHKRGGHKRRRR